jgi:hypothetical protein
MDTLAPDSKFNNMIQYMGANRWHDTKNQAQMLIAHCAVQVEQ